MNKLPKPLTEILYHASPNKFNHFKLSERDRSGGAVDFGVHFGTYDAAINRIEMLQREGVKIQEAYIYTVEVNLGDNILFLEEGRMGSWSIDMILQRIFESDMEVVSDEEIDQYWDDIVESPSGVNLKETMPEFIRQKEFIKWLDAHEITAIQYENLFESGMSYLVWHLDRIDILRVDRIDI